MERSLGNKVNATLRLTGNIDCQDVPDYSPSVLVEIMPSPIPVFQSVQVV